MMTQITPDLNLQWLADGGCLLRVGDTQIVLTDAEVARLRRWLDVATAPEVKGAPV